MAEVTPPRLEGTTSVGGRRRLGFAEFGAPDGRAIFWLHGTPGARRQVPETARSLAEEQGLRIIGIDRPGIGSSTPHVYDRVVHFATDLERVADSLGVQEMAVVGLSGGGPYALAAGHALPDRVVGVGVLGGVAPVRGVDAIDGGLVRLGARMRPVVALTRVPTGVALAGAVRLARPLASPAIDVYARLSPAGDRALLRRPEFKAMFLDDLLNGSRRQMAAPVADLLTFTKHWGFLLADVGVPVRWWHGDADHIVPFGHGVHAVDKLPDAELRVLPGESHLGGLGAAEDILATVTDLWDRR